MDERFIDISDAAASLTVHLEQLVIKRDDTEETVPLEDLAALVISHPAVHLSFQVLSAIMDHGGAVVVCNEKRLPVGLLLPIVSHFVQAEQIAAQAEATIPLKKALWKQIIRAKITAQGRLLQKVRGDDCALTALLTKVHSGDYENIEGQASRRYWPALFGPEFRRIPGATGPTNRLLNYGYAVLRGIVGRAVCAAGLHPSLGLHHHNRYNPFCLADDLMEPFRPLVDEAVLTVLKERGADAELDRETKALLIGPLMTGRFRMGDRELTLFDVAGRVAASLADVFMGKREKLALPEM